MAGSERDELEARVAKALDDGAIELAATSLLRGYGPEILGFLSATLRDEASAEDVFGIFTEQLVKALPTFERRSSVRTWAYTVARHAAQRYAKQRRRRAGREVHVAGSVADVAIQVRSETAAYLRTEVKTRFAALRDSLPEEDRALLILRVDKGLEWTEIATILFGDGGGSTPADLKKESARLRKRFQTVKERLVELGKKEGLLP